MKKIYRQTVLLILTAFVSSCNGWLDVAPTTELDRDDLFKRESGFGEALTGVYAAMCDASLYGRTLTWQLLDLMSGYYTPETPFINGNYSNYVVQYTYQNSSDAYVRPSINLIWSNMYKQIANLNSLLEVIDEQQMVFNNNNYFIVKGEAIGLRAFLHLELLKMYGEAYPTGKNKPCIPFMDQLSKTTSPLLTVDQALERIIEELKTAKELLKKDPMYLDTAPDRAITPPAAANRYGITVWHNRRLTFNYYAAIATMARAYLWKEDKAQALDCAKEIIKEQEQRFEWVRTDNLTTLTSGTAENQDRTFATEHIFALNVTRLENLTEGYFYLTGTGSEMQALNSPYAYIYENNPADPRMQYLIENVGPYSLLTKFYQDEEALETFKKRLPLIRLSEMYYIAAECEPDLNTATEYLNEVRRHRSLTTPVTPANRQELQDEILKEYKKEFLGEGQLWFYYKRHNFEQIPLCSGGTMPHFSSTSLYTFERPQDEDFYGGRENEL